MSKFFLLLPSSLIPALSLTLCNAVVPATPRHAPSIADTFSGLFAVVLMGATAYSANDPPVCSNDVISQVII